MTASSMHRASEGILSPHWGFGLASEECRHVHSCYVTSNFKTKTHLHDVQNKEIKHVVKLLLISFYKCIQNLHAPPTCHPVSMDFVYMASLINTIPGTRRYTGYLTLAKLFKSTQGQRMAQDCHTSTHIYQTCYWPITGPEGGLTFYRGRGGGKRTVKKEKTKQEKYTKCLSRHNQSRPNRKEKIKGKRWSTEQEVILIVGGGWEKRHSMLARECRFEVSKRVEVISPAGT